MLATSQQHLEKLTGFSCKAPLSKELTAVQVSCVSLKFLALIFWKSYKARPDCQKLTILLNSSSKADKCPDQKRGGQFDRVRRASSHTSWHR